MNLHSIEVKAPNTKLNRIEERSKRDRRALFNNLGHVIDLDLLRECYASLDGSKAVGVDGVTKEEYGKSLEGNLRALLMKIRKQTYIPRASRIREIPKADGNMRPLAIACFEDKIVQEAVRRVLERIYEPLFLECSYGFRPKRSCHMALAALNGYLMDWHCGAVLEIDLRQYFNTIPHESLVRLLKLKIADTRFLWLITKLLKAPSQTADGNMMKNEIGSPQGSILSPVIANLFLHYVIDVWFAWLNQTRLRNSGKMVRYADDAVFVFRTLEEARTFLHELRIRLESFGISLNEEKTKAIVFGRKPSGEILKKGLRPPTFSFLGFIHVWRTSWNRKRGVSFLRVQRRTCPKRFRKKLAEIKQYIRSNRHDKNLLVSMTRVVRGYLNYFAINDNKQRITQFLREVERLLFKWLNRRSQKGWMEWQRFRQILERVGWPKPKILKDIFFESSHYRPKASEC